MQNEQLTMSEENKRIDKVKTVYILDDDEIIIYLTNKIIRDAQFCDNSEIFMSGQDALDRLKLIIKNREELPDVMLIDINMPGMNGWEFLDEFEKLPLEKPIPLFVFTSSINLSDREKSFTYPSIKGFIQKPLTVIKLDKILRLIS